MSIVEMVPNVFAHICLDGRANFVLEVLKRTFIIFSMPKHLNQYLKQLGLIFEIVVVDIVSVDLHYVIGLVFLENLYKLGPTEAQF